MSIITTPAECLLLRQLLRSTMQERSKIITTQVAPTFHSLRCKAAVFMYCGRDWWTFKATAIDVLTYICVYKRLTGGLNDGLFSETMDFRDFPSVLFAVRIAQS